MNRPVFEEYLDDVHYGTFEADMEREYTTEFRVDAARLLLDQCLFARLDDVREATWRFLIDYNEHRPHDALGGMTPAEYRNHHEAGSSTFELSA
jgi:putative transposase